MGKEVFASPKPGPAVHGRSKILAERARTAGHPDQVTHLLSARSAAGPKEMPAIIPYLEI
jgi:hypothetical protein